METVIQRLMTVALSALVCVAAAAQVKIDLNESYKGGTVEVTGQSAPADDGSVVVTITVTPDFGYKIAKSDLLVVPTYSPSVTRSDEPVVAEPLQLSGDDPEDLTEKRDYTFTVPKDLGAWVKEANFREADIQNDISGDAASSVTWKLDVESGVMTISGTGRTKDFAADDKMPWAAAKDKVVSVVIEKGVTALGANLLAGCTGLVSVKIENNAQLLSLGAGAFPANEGLQIDVPGNLYNACLADEGWSGLPVVSANKVTLAGVSFAAGNQYSAFVSAEALMVPSVLKAYVVSGVSGTSLSLTEVTTLSPGVPVLLYGNGQQGSEFYTAADTDGAKAAPSSLLQAAPEGGREVKLGEVYILHNDVFYYAQAGTIPAGGIYLTVPEPAKSRAYYALGTRGTTAIALPQSPAARASSASAWYTLDGRRLSGQPVRKGIYLRDGKKVIVR